MAQDPIVYVAPVIWGSVLAEAIHLRGTPRAYSARRLASALGCLSYDYLVGAATVVAFIGAFAAIHARVGATVFDAPAGAGGLVLGVAVTVVMHDFLYYAYH